MDGINPTLAFAALFFGLSSNAHHAPDNPAAQVELQNMIDCPALVASGDPAPSPHERTLMEAFEINVPDLAGRAEKSAYASAGPINPDPIVRQIVPVATSLPATDSEPSPCGSDR